jgi:hypothetical protein
MVIDRNETKLTTIGQIREFLAGTADVYWTPEDDDKARYAFIRDVLSRFDYPRLVRPDKGLIRAYLEHTSGYSRAQLARLYTDSDVRLLAAIDALHCTLVRLWPPRN